MEVHGKIQTCYCIALDACMLFVSVVYRGVDVIRRVVEQSCFAPLEVYDEKKDGKCGIWLTDTIKENACGALQLALSNGQVAFAKEFVTNEKEASGKQADRKIQDMYREQLANFRVEMVMPNDISIGKTKLVYTGKTSSGRKGNVFTQQSTVLKRNICFTAVCLMRLLRFV